MRNLFLIFWLFSTTSFALLESQKRLMAEKEALIQNKFRVEKRIAELKQTVKNNMIQYHKFKNGAGTPEFIWQKGEKISVARKHVEKLLKNMIQQDLRNLERNRDYQSQVRAQLNWVQADLEDRFKISNPVIIKVDKDGEAQRNPYCRLFPVSSQNSKIPPQIQKKYNEKISVAGDAVYRSKGWWITKVSGDAVACYSGRIVFSGKVVGLGNVVVVDHGYLRTTVYGRLTRMTKNLKVGSWVTTGTRLGSVQNHFYFEYRMKNVPQNPKVFMSRSAISKLSVN